MKKVKSIGKKVMSVGLAASLLMAPVSVNKCSALKFNFNIFNRGQSQQGSQNQQAAQAGNQNAQQGAQSQQPAPAGNQNVQQGAQNQQAAQAGNHSALNYVLYGAKAIVGIAVIAFLIYLGGNNAKEIKSYVQAFADFYKNNKETIDSIGNGMGSVIKGLWQVVKSGGSVGIDVCKVLFKFIKSYGKWNALKDAASIYGAGVAFCKVKNWVKGEPKKRKVIKATTTVNLEDCLEQN